MKNKTKIMKKKSGIIYLTEQKEYGVALYADQQEVFSKQGKLLLHIYTDAACTIQKTRIDGRQFNSIESISKLKQVGFTD